MKRYIGKKVKWALVTVVVASFAIFAIVDAWPGGFLVCICHYGMAGEEVSGSTCHLHQAPGLLERFDRWMRGGF